MNVFYEEDGGFKVGSVLADNNTSLQVEAPHGKRSKIKSAAVLLRFEQPGAAQFLPLAEQAALEMDVDFLWQCSGTEEFSFSDLGREYFGHELSPVEAAAVLLRLHGAPMYFYKKGKGRYRAAPEENLRAALASVERKRQQELLIVRYAEELKGGKLPEEFRPHINALLYKPDKNSAEYKALESACDEAHLTPVQLLERCGGIISSHDYHLNRFLFENFPRGLQFPQHAADTSQLAELPRAQVRAFSIDDVTTTEIDDAFSVARLADGDWQIGIHIAAPALAIAPGSALDECARDRLSTVYMPGGKITMLPEAVIDAFSLAQNRDCPSLSLYLHLTPEDLRITHSHSRVELVPIAANLHHDKLEPIFADEAHAQVEFAPELRLLHQLAQQLEAARGKAGEAAEQRVEYNFYVDDDRVRIVRRMRGSPVDKIVAELMIYANAHWGGLLAQNQVAGIYRSQTNGKVMMSTEPAAHEGIGVKQYAWASSPLRRYVDLVNQRQLIALFAGAAPPYVRGAALQTVVRDFEQAYDIYAEFQRGMERYWCLRYLLQENITQAPATLIRENLVRLDAIPLYCRVSAQPGLQGGAAVTVELDRVDLWNLEVNCKLVRHA